MKPGRKWDISFQGSSPPDKGQDNLLFLMPGPASCNPDLDMAASGIYSSLSIVWGRVSIAMFVCFYFLLCFLKMTRGENKVWYDSTDMFHALSPLDQHFWWAPAKIWCIWGTAIPGFGPNKGSSHRARLRPDLFLNSRLRNFTSARRVQKIGSHGRLWSRKRHSFNIWGALGFTCTFSRANPLPCRALHLNSTLFLHWRNPAWGAQRR